MYISTAVNLRGTTTNDKKETIEPFEGLSNLPHKGIKDFKYQF